MSEGYECLNLQKQQLYLIGGASSVVFYTLITASINWFGNRIGRNQDLLISSFTALIVCVISAYISITTPYADPTGLNLGRLQQLTGLISIPLFLSVLFCSLGSLHRYCSYMESTTKIFVKLTTSILFILLTLACIITQVYNVIGEVATSNNIVETYQNGTIYACDSAFVCESIDPSSPSLRTVVTNFTIGIPLIHLMFGFWLANFKIKAPNVKFKTLIQRIDAVVLDILGFVVPMLWFIYVVILLQPVSNNAIQGEVSATNTSLQSTGLLGCIYLLLHSFVLYAETSIPSSNLILGSVDVDDDEIQNNNFFIATAANGQEGSMLQIASKS